MPPVPQTHNHTARGHEHLCPKHRAAISAWRPAPCRLFLIRWHLRCPFIRITPEAQAAAPPAQEPLAPPSPPLSPRHPPEPRTDTQRPPPSGPGLRPSPGPPQARGKPAQPPPRRPRPLGPYLRRRRAPSRPALGTAGASGRVGGGGCGGAEPRRHVTASREPPPTAQRGRSLPSALGALPAAQTRARPAPLPAAPRSCLQTHPGTRAAPHMKGRVPRRLPSLLARAPPTSPRAQWNAGHVVQRGGAKGGDAAGLVPPTGRARLPVWPEAAGARVWPRLSGCRSDGWPHRARLRLQGRDRRDASVRRSEQLQPYSFLLRMFAFQCPHPGSTRARTAKPNSARPTRQHGSEDFHRNSPSKSVLQGAAAGAVLGDIAPSTSQPSLGITRPCRSSYSYSTYGI